MVRNTAVAAGFLFTALSARFALGADAEPIALDFIAPGDCPTAAEFEREITARTNQARFVGRNPSRTFHVRIERHEAEYAGSLDVSSRTEPPAHREITGEKCESVALVLAIAAALAIDPEADTTPTTRLTEQPPPSVAPAPRPPVTAPPAPLPAPLPTKPAPPENSIDLGAAMTFTGGPAPRTLIAPAPFVEFESLRGPVAPLVRLEPIFAKTGFIGPDFADARFTWYALRASVCPLRVGTTLSVRPCAVADGGLVRAEGVNIAKPATHNRGWFAFGLEARVRWDFAEAVFVDAAAGAKLRAVHDRYVFTLPDSELYEVPWLSPAAEIGLGVRFF